MAKKKKYEIDPSGKFAKAIKKATKDVSDLRIPFGLMTREWYKANRSIFELKGPGKYEDLRPRTKTEKIRLFGKVYPILEASDALKLSMTVPGNTGSVANIINKTILVLGTKVKSQDGEDYPSHLHFGFQPRRRGKKVGKKVKARPFVLLGGEQVATPRINLRRKLWIEMLEQYVLDVSKEFAT